MPLDIEFEDPGEGPASLRVQGLAQTRLLLAQVLRRDHPGRWAVISTHASTGGARRVKSRYQTRPEWSGFEITVRKQPDGTAKVYARFVGSEEQ